ncbi:hypothetical protein [Draconibacterium orientale]|uniref:hypothetical protein n=1 Tax=Draconibacterium orientale TaxID=1168034 RepID=UPI002ABE3284|nr:hypothetical protein [Draconibacterium orientale]
MLTFAAALREAMFIERMGLGTAKAGPGVDAKITVFKSVNGSKKKSLEKSQKVFGSLINLLTFAAALKTKRRSSDKLKVRNE